MNIFKHLKSLCCLLILSCTAAHSLQAQSDEYRQISLELTLDNGEETVVSKIKTFSYSYTLPTVSTEDMPEQLKPCYIVIGYDIVDISLLKLLNKQHPNLNAELLITDSYAQFAPRKILLKSLTLDGIYDQINASDTNSFINISCKKLIIDGVEIKN